MEITQPQTTLKLKIQRESDIDSVLRVLVNNNYRIWITEEVVDKVGKTEIKTYFINAEKPN